MKAMILSEISSYFNGQVDERQLYNHIKDQGDYLELKAYGNTLRFDKQTGGLIHDE